MSTQSIARWNSIPLANTNDNLKRPHHIDGDDDDGDDDNISLVSRSPSPPLQDAMDVDSLSKYDEYVRRGHQHEVITVETRIKSSNKGFAMLEKLGWAQGQPLGISGDGRVDPIPFQIKADLTGLGKINQDVRMIETTVSQRRGLDSERQHKETEDQRKAREDTVARQQALKSELSTTLAAFFCSLCSKQFKTVAQYDEHTNSYAHHHKARMKDMAASAKGMGVAGAGLGVGMGGEKERKEKERKREEKELRRAAKAAGVRMAKPVSAPVVTAAPPAPLGEGDTKPLGFKKSGWATVSSVEPPTPVPPPTPAASNKGGWSSVGSSSLNTQPPAPSSSSSVAPPPPPASRNTGSPPAFRTAGWTSLDTGSSQPPPPSHLPPVPVAASSLTQAPIPPPPTSVVPPLPPNTTSNYPPRPTPTQSNQSQASTRQWGTFSSTRDQLPPSTNPNMHQNYGNRAYPPGPMYQHPPPSHPSYNQLPPPPPPSQLQNPPPVVRSGWQQWNSSAGGSKRR